MEGSLQMEQIPSFSPLLAKEAVIKMKKEDEKSNSAEKLLNMSARVVPVRNLETDCRTYLVKLRLLKKHSVALSLLTSLSISMNIQ
jgi:hypothetical protein